MTTSIVDLSAELPPGQPAERLLWTPEEVMALFSITRGTFVNWELKGVFKAIRVGRRVYVPDSEIQRLLGTA